MSNPQSRTRSVSRDAALITRNRTASVGSWGTLPACHVFVRIRNHAKGTLAAYPTKSLHEPRTHWNGYPGGGLLAIGASQWDSGPLPSKGPRQGGDRLAQQVCRQPDGGLKRTASIASHGFAPVASGPSPLAGLGAVVPGESWGKLPACPVFGPLNDSFQGQASSSPHEIGPACEKHHGPSGLCRNSWRPQTRACALLRPGLQDPARLGAGRPRLPIALNPPEAERGTVAPTNPMRGRVTDVDRIGMHGIPLRKYHARLFHPQLLRLLPAHAAATFYVSEWRSRTGV